VDTDRVPGYDTRVGDLVQNEVEAELVYQFAETLIGCGIKEEQIGIITLYRQQIKLLSHLLIDRKGIEILTADRSQGRDKDCIIISMVRSNVEGQVRVLNLGPQKGMNSKARNVDWRPHEGLETVERLVNSSPVEVGHNRFAKDSPG
jgi:hypothetical protein